VSELFERLTGWQLLDPVFLLLLPLPPVALWVRRRRARRAVRFAPAALGPLPRSLRVRLLGLPALLWALGLGGVVLALARPAERVRLPSATEGIDMLLCVDTSSSMAAPDPAGGGTRLDLAREAATAFVRARAHDRIGLLSFARYPDLRCPPTLDHEALAAILSRVSTVASEGPEDFTGIGNAVARAAQILDGGGATSPVVILLTDGEENVATRGTAGEIAPVHAAQLCRTLGVRVYAIAVGGDSRSGPRAPPDLGALEKIAATTGGALFRAGDAPALRAAYARIDDLERSGFEEERHALEERQLPLLLLSVVLLLAGRGGEATLLRVVP